MGQFLGGILFVYKDRNIITRNLFKNNQAGLKPFAKSIEEFQKETTQNKMTEKWKKVIKYFRRATNIGGSKLKFIREVLSSNLLGDALTVAGAISSRTWSFDLTTTSTKNIDELSSKVEHQLKTIQEEIKKTYNKAKEEAKIAKGKK